MPVIVPATSTSTSDTSSADRSASDANKRDDENTPSEVLHAAPTQEVLVAATAEDDYYHDLSTLSETNDECDSEFCAGTCSSNVLQQIGQTFIHFFFGCNSLKKSSSTGRETYTRTTTTEGSIECASPCCSPTNPNSPTGMSMIARPSVSSYQRGEMNKVKIATNEENWDHAFRKGSLALLTNSTKKPRSRKDKKKTTNSSYYSTPKKRGGKAFATGSDRSALTTASKKTSSESMSEPTYTLQGSTIKVPTLTLSPSKSSTSRKDPPTPFQSPMSSLSRSSAAFSSTRAFKSHQSTRKVIRQASVHQATPLYPLANPTPVSCRQGLGVITGKKTIVLPPGYLHNFELADDHMSFKAGPVVSWAPATHSGGVSIGDHA